MDVYALGFRAWGFGLQGSGCRLKVFGSASRAGLRLAHRGSGFSLALLGLATAED